MPTAIHSSPPPRRRTRLLEFPLPVDHALGPRRRGFWAGWGGIAATVVMGALVVALLVGWVLLWVYRPGGPSIPLLALGCVAFTLLVAFLATAQLRLHAHWRIRQAEALFLTGVSHNLRTPISAIRAAAQALQSDNLPTQRRERLLQAIVHETRRLALRVENALLTSRIEVQRGAFGGTAIDLADLVRQACREAAGMAAFLGGELRFEARQPCWFHGDASAVRLLLDNLLDNALKYTDGPPRIEVELAPREEFFLLSVRDKGLGFSPSTAGLLFRRRSRGDTSRSGTGLGLPLARAIARGHGGDLYLHSDGPGSGSVAEVWLPKPRRR